MKNFASILLISLVLVLAGGISETRADNLVGVCNAAIADGLGPGLRFVHGVGDPMENCVEVGNALLTFLTTPGCFDAFAAGELPGISTASTAVAGPNEGLAKPLGEAICEALLGCGFGPGLPPEICPE
jgi:hypothetical protein